MSESDELSAAQKIRQAALKEAADYHARLANTPTATGGASAAKVTATATEFLIFLERVVDKAGVERDVTPAGDSDRGQSNRDQSGRSTPSRSRRS